MLSVGVRVRLQPLRSLLSEQLLGRCLFKSRSQVDAERPRFFKSVTVDADAGRFLGDKACSTVPRSKIVPLSEELQGALSDISQ